MSAQHHHDHDHGHGHEHGHHHHHGPEDLSNAPPRYVKVLWVALVLNAGMFLVEIFAGLESRSVSLLADAIDFFGDSTSYALSLAVLGSAPIWRSRTALFKAACMALFGVFVLGRALWSVWSGATPDAQTMGMVGLMALCVNVTVAALLYAFRTGDANMRSVWLCSRNDALSNVAVIFAALGVFGTHTAWPDLLVAAVMGCLALSSAVQVFFHARQEMMA